MKPTIGRIVHYQLSQSDADTINQYTERHNKAIEGDVYPAMIVRVWNPSVNLQVFFDGEGSYWATSRNEGIGSGTWSWPAPRLMKISGSDEAAIKAVQEAQTAIDSLQGKTVKVVQARRHGLMVCTTCEEEFDPIHTRWLCPNCKTKHSCCEGGPA